MNSGAAQGEYGQENLRDSSLLEEVTVYVLFLTSKIVLYVYILFFFLVPHKLHFLLMPFPCCFSSDVLLQPFLMNLSAPFLK